MAAQALRVLFASALQLACVTAVAASSGGQRGSRMRLMTLRALLMVRAWMHAFVAARARDRLELRAVNVALVTA